MNKTIELTEKDARFIKRQYNTCITAAHDIWAIAALLKKYDGDCAEVVSEFLSKYLNQLAEKLAFMNVKVDEFEIHHKIAKVFPDPELEKSG